MFVDMEKGLRPFDPAYVHVHGAADILHVILSAVVVLVEIDGHSRDKNRCRFVRGRVRRHCQSSRPRYHAAAKISPVEAKNHSDCSALHAGR